jgi:hypothetical protein
MKKKTHHVGVAAYNGPAFQMLQFRDTLSYEQDVLFQLTK